MTMFSRLERRWEREDAEGGEGYIARSKSRSRDGGGATLGREDKRDSTSGKQTTPLTHLDPSGKLLMLPLHACCCYLAPRLSTGIWGRPIVLLARTPLSGDPVRCILLQSTRRRARQRE